MYSEPSSIDLAFTVVVVVAMLANSVRDRFTDDDPDEHTIDGAREAYANGEITLDEYERRVALAVDPETERLQAAVEPITGVGEVTSRQLAQAFDSLDELRDADREELEAVHGVGESTAKAIRERFE